LPGGPGDKGESEELQGLQQVINNVKAVVRYIKKSGLNAALQKSVVQENDTLEQYAVDVRQRDCSGERDQGCTEGQRRESSC